MYFTKIILYLILKKLIQYYIYGRISRTFHISIKKIMEKIGNFTILFEGTTLLFSAIG